MLAVNQIIQDADTTLFNYGHNKITVLVQRYYILQILKLMWLEKTSKHAFGSPPHGKNNG
jgi:hypothetical protein